MPATPSNEIRAFAVRPCDCPTNTDCELAEMRVLNVVSAVPLSCFAYTVSESLPGERENRVEFGSSLHPNQARMSRIENPRALSRIVTRDPADLSGGRCFLCGHDPPDIPDRVIEIVGNMIDLHAPARGRRKILLAIPGR